MSVTKLTEVSTRTFLSRDLFEKVIIEKLGLPVTYGVLWNAPLSENFDSLSINELLLIVEELLIETKSPMPAQGVSIPRTFSDLYRDYVLLTLGDPARE